MVVCSDGIAAMVHRKRVRNEGVVAEMHEMAMETAQRCSDRGWHDEAQSAGAVRWRRQQGRRWQFDGAVGSATHSRKGM